MKFLGFGIMIKTSPELKYIVSASNEAAFN